MKKNIVAAAVVIILFVLPAGSWYYLQNGFDYRKASLETLKPKGAIQDVQLVTFNNDTLSTTQVLKNRTSIVFNESQSNVKSEDIDAILNQYGNAYTFQFVHILTEDNSMEETDNDDIVMLNRIGSQKLINQMGKHTFCLIDTGMRIRQMYMSERNDLTKLVEHVAIVLPRIPGKHIKIKSESK